MNAHFPPSSSVSEGAATIHTYCVFTLTGELLPAASIDAAKQAILDRYPNVHFGRWFDADRARNLPAWENAGDELRFELGETQDDNRPVAYVRVQDWQVTF